MDLTSQYFCYRGLKFLHCLKSWENAGTSKRDARVHVEMCYNVTFILEVGLRLSTIFIYASAQVMDFVTLFLVMFLFLKKQYFLTFGYLGSFFFFFLFVCFVLFFCLQGGHFCQNHTWMCLPPCRILKIWLSLYQFFAQLPTHQYSIFNRKPTNFAQILVFFYNNVLKIHPIYVFGLLYLW